MTLEQFAVLDDLDSYVVFQRVPLEEATYSTSFLTIPTRHLENFHALVFNQTLNRTCLANHRFPMPVCF